MNEEFDLNVYMKKLKESAKGTLWDYLGFEVEEARKEEVRVKLKAEPYHLNGIGILNGGVHASMLDNTMGIIAMAARPNHKVVTSTLHLHYLAPVLLEEITAVAKILHESRSLITTEGKLLGADGRLCAYGTASYRVQSAQSLR